LNFVLPESRKTPIPCEAFAGLGQESI